MFNFLYIHLKSSEIQNNPKIAKIPLVLIIFIPLFYHKAEDILVILDIWKK